jgi:dihydrofolate reductase
MRKLIAAMKVSLDSKYDGPEGMADWAADWSDDYGLTEQIDACLLGGAMYPGYENYWSGIMADPGKPAWITGAPPTEAELKWAEFIKRTPHHVLSNTVTTANWPMTRFLRNADEVAAMKQQPGKDIYLMGGGRLVDSLTEAGLVDELRLVVYPLIGGEGKTLFATMKHRRALDLKDARAMSGGRMLMTYAVKGDR